MLTVLKKEYIYLLRSIKAIIIVLIFVLFSYYISNLLLKYLALKLDENSLYSSIKLLVAVFGFLFVSVLSHNAINKEIELKTIRLMVTKISRAEFFIGKYLGTLLFWYSCLTVSYVLISLIGGMFGLYSYCLIIVLITYFVSLSFFLSTVISKSAVSNFVGLILGLVIPIFGIWSVDTTNPIWSHLKYLFPYYYMMKEGAYLLILLVLSVGMIGTATLLLDGKEF